MEKNAVLEVITKVSSILQYSLGNNSKYFKVSNKIYKEKMSARY